MVGFDLNIPWKAKLPLLFGILTVIIGNPAFKGGYGCFYSE
jgi:hypothetical protein